jgi:hypothetical protein
MMKGTTANVYPVFIKDASLLSVGPKWAIRTLTPYRLHELLKLIAPSGFVSVGSTCSPSIEMLCNRGEYHSSP